MSQRPPEPRLPAASLSSAQLNEAYRRGYLDGHLAGWRDAVAPKPFAPQGVKAAQAQQRLPETTVPIPARPQRYQPAPMQQPFFQAQQPPSFRPQPQPQPQSQSFVTPPAAADSPALAAAKSKRETQNINITLYIASLFMVAAAALFVASSLPVPARLVGVWLGTAVFYGAGLVLHSTVARLRPAAVAFVGTALAMVPFAGLATYDLGFPNAPGVWLLTSVIGTAAYFAAAVKLESRLVVYLSMAFLVSTAWSSGAVLGAALSWYFTALILISALLSLTGHILNKRTGGGSSRVGFLTKPLSELGPWFAPVGLVSSLVFSLTLNAADHALVLLAGALYYAVMIWVDAPALRRWNYLGLRLSLTLVAPFIGWMLGGSFVFAAGAATLGLAAQLVIVSYLRKAIGSGLGTPSWPRNDVYLCVPLTAVLSVVWSIGIGQSANDAGIWVWSPAVPLVVGLLAAMAAVPAWLPRGEWLPLPALAAPILVSDMLSAHDWALILTIALVYTVTRFLTSSVVWIRRAMLFAARIFVTGLIASSMAALIPAQAGKAEVIVAVIAVIAAGQLVADTLIGKYGIANPVTAVSGTVWAVLGTVLVVGLAGTATAVTLARAGSLGLALQLAFLLAVLAMGAAVCTHSAVFLPRDGRYAVAEIMAPVFLVVASFSAGAVFGAAGASIGLGGLTLFLATAGWRLRAGAIPMHRWLYWWGARAASLLLAVAMFALWQEHEGAPSIGNADVSLGMLLLVVLAGQLMILAAAKWNSRTSDAFSFDVFFTAALTVVVAWTQIVFGVSGQWSETLSIGLVVAALGLLSCAYALRSPGPEPAQWVAPLATVAVASMTLQTTFTFEIAAALMVAASALCARRGLGHRIRSVHFLLARAVASALIVVVATAMTDSPTTAALVFSAVMLVQLGVQRMAVVPTVAAVVGEPRVVRISLWLLLAAQVIAPIAYVAATGGLEPQGSGYRWVVVLELILMAVSALVAQSAFGQRGASYLGILAVVGAASVVAPVLWPGITTLILAGICVAVIVWRCLHVPTTTQMRWYWLAATAAFLLTAVVVDSGAPPGAFAVMWLVSGLAFVAAAQVQRLPWLTLPGAVMVFLAAILVRGQLLELGQALGVAALAGFVMVVGGLYMARLPLWDLPTAVPAQRWSLVVVALGGGVIFAVLAMADRGVILGGAGAFTAVAVLACFEAPPLWRRTTIDISIVATALIWFIASTVYVDLGVFWFVQWCAVALGALALLRYVAKQPRAGRALLMAAGSLASFGGLLTMFSGEPLPQLVSLLLFVALLVVGLSVDERMFTIWGAIGVVVSVLWYWRGFTFVLLAVLALALIGLAVWRLNRKKPHDAVTGTPPPGTVPSGQSPGDAI